MLLSEELQPHTKVVIGGAQGELAYKTQALPQRSRSVSPSPLGRAAKRQKTSFGSASGPVVEEIDSDDDMDVDGNDRGRDPNRR